MSPAAQGTVPDDRLPLGFGVCLDPDVRRLRGELLLGGAPPRVLRLSRTARRLLADGAFEVADEVSRELARRLLDAGIAHPRPRPRERGVSVVVPVHGRAAELARLLAALRATLPACSEVLVVDDGSAVPTVVPAGVRLIRLPAPGGPAAARNRGLAAARHELVAFLDSDVVPETGWLAPLLAQFDDPAVALAAPRIVGLRGAGRGALARYEAVRSSLDLGGREALIVPRTRVAYVPSAALVVRAAAVPDGFCARMRVAEDVDLVTRLHRAGWRLRYVPGARVAHEHRERFGPWVARKAFYGTGAAPLALRHPGTVPPVNMPLWAAACCVLLGAQRPAAALGACAVGGAIVARLTRRVGAAPAARLTALAAGGALWQSAAALTRHWWPLAVVAATRSARARRALVVAAVAEGAGDWWRHRGGLDPVRYVLLHRLDDLAYGTGLWWGALRRRTLRPLLPRLPR